MNYEKDVELWLKVLWKWQKLKVWHCYIDKNDPIKIYSEGIYLFGNHLPFN